MFGFESAIEEPVELSIEEKKKLFDQLKSELEPEDVIEEPRVSVKELKIPNKSNPGMGYFELDWNNSFVDMLIDAGYKGKSDEKIVESWFIALCKSIIAEEENNKE